MINKTAERYEYLREKYGTEKVFIVPFSHTNIIPDDFTPWDPEHSARDIYGSVLPYGKFIMRADAEEDITFQQIIPYVLVKTTDGKFFVTRRINGEQRLQGKLSLGVGGHINPRDDTRDGCEKMIKNGLERELTEEVKIPKVRKIRIYEYGTVRDLQSTTPDHIGIVFIQEVDSPKNIKVRETENLEGLWMTIDELKKNLSSLESWAKLIVAQLVFDEQKKNQ